MNSIATESRNATCDRVYISNNGVVDNSEHERRFVMVRNHAREGSGMPG